MPENKSGGRVDAARRAAQLAWLQAYESLARAGKLGDQAETIGTVRPAALDERGCLAVFRCGANGEPALTAACEVRGSRAREGEVAVPCGALERDQRVGGRNPVWVARIHDSQI